MKDYGASLVWPQPPKALTATAKKFQVKNDTNLIKVFYVLTYFFIFFCALYFNSNLKLIIMCTILIICQSDKHVSYKTA